MVYISKAAGPCFADDAMGLEVRAYRAWLAGVGKGSDAADCDPTSARLTPSNHPFDLCFDNSLNDCGQVLVQPRLQHRAKYVAYQLFQGRLWLLHALRRPANCRRNCDALL
jgi:hypothetical protein